MRHLIVGLLLFCTTLNYAQTEFEKGYFINNQGKKTECLIENKDWQHNPTNFNYKLTPDGEVKTENILGVSEFAIDNVSLYKRFTVDVERSSTVTSQVQRNKIPAYKNETLFLQAIVTGKANLYTLSDVNVYKFFYQVADKPIEQLIMIRYMTTDYFEQNNQFRQQLYNNVRCEKTPESDFKNIEYQTKPLVALFKTYNSCFADATASTVDYTAKDRNRDTFVLRVTPGVNMTTLKVNDPNQFYNVSTDFKKTVFTMALEFEYVFPFNNGAWSLFVQPGYQKFDAENNFTRASVGFNGNNPITYKAKVDYAALEFPIGIKRYFFVNKTSKIFVKAGIVVNTTMTSDPKIVYTNTDNLPNGTKDMPISARNNFTAGIGYCFNRLSAELRYNSPRELSNILSWRAKYSSLGLNVGYKIF